MSFCGRYEAWVKRCRERRAAARLAARVAKAAEVERVRLVEQEMERRVTVWCAMKLTQRPARTR
jgi:hypothetical protein